MSRRSSEEKRARVAVKAFLRIVASGGQPSREDLEREGFPAKHHSEILEVARRILEHRDAGAFGEARRLALEAGPALLEDLGTDWAPPAPPGPDWDQMTAEELADKIARW